MVLKWYAPFFNAYSFINRAYLVRKVVEGASEPLYVMGVVAGHTWREGRSEQDSQGLLNQLLAEIDLGRPSVFVTLEGHYEFLEKTFSSIPAARVFPSR
jgi:hypothetical protein